MPTSIQLPADPVPLVLNADGCMRVGNSRVTLDTIVAAYREGMTAEGIAEQYPSVRLAEVYVIIGYILNHSKEVETYLAERRRIADAVRIENETQFDPSGVRIRLMARKH